MSIARALADSSAREIADALGARRPPVRAIALALARVPSRRLGHVLSRFDARTEEVGIARAAHETLDALGARVVVEGALAEAGPAMIVSNHPGAYDALSVMAALGRNDIVFVAADRAFLRALPNVGKHLLLADERSATARAAALRRAIEHLEGGGVVVQYGAGAIEPDVRFDAGVTLAEWSPGTGMLAARASNVPVVPVFVSGVHSPRAKRLPFVRWAERRGITTIAPLVQATVPGFRDVVVSVRIGEAIDLSTSASRDHVGRTALIRRAVARLGETPPRSRPTSEGSGHTAPHSSRARSGAPSSA